MTRYFLPLVGLALVFLQLSCRKDTDLAVNEHEIKLKWHKGYEEDNIVKSTIGLAWVFSHLGASNATAVYDLIPQSNVLVVNLYDLGFDKTIIQKLERLNHHLRFSEEYIKTGSVDMGRYTALLLGASEHYYALVQMPNTYAELLANYNLREEEGYVDNSIITGRHRIIRFSEQLGLNQIFVAEERNEVTGEVIEYETLDLMPNGQVRFGIFDADGQRKTHSDPLQTEAGKPAKCMWCHESSVQPLFSEQGDFEGYFTYLQLRDTLTYYRETHREKKNALTTGVDFSKTQDHAFMELLYTTFMEPSISRLALEWDMSEAEVASRLEGIPTHLNVEYPFLGERYFRHEVNGLAPFKGLSVSSSVREPSAIEVNYMY